MKTTRRHLLLAALSAAALPASHAQTTPPLRVVASFSILADLVREVGGELVDVTAMVGPDGDAHTFEPRPADARRLADAELVVVNGLGFEGWLDRLVAASGSRAPIAVASEGIVPRRHGAAPDPHAWQDLAHARRYVANIRDALVRARPAQAATLRERALACDTKLAALDTEVRQRIATVAPAQRRVITSHDAFGYFGAAYGIEFLPARGFGGDTEASAADVARLVEQIRKQGVRAVFVENISDPRLVQRIAHEGGAVVGGRLYSDALSPAGGPADTYLKLFAYNANALVAGMSTAAKR
jgi:zinc/manganese transport system substrate-binding protein